MISLFSLFKKKAPKAPKEPTVYTKVIPIVDIKVIDEREREFRFERTYTLRLTDYATLVMNIDQSICMSYYSKLIQPDGRYITFDHKSIAEKILDPVLVPLVEIGVARIIAEDRYYRSHKNITQNTLVDSNGNKWVKEPR